jgi:hydroxymethylglutaryl-CoA reductase (NADPH)
MNLRDFSGTKERREFLEKILSLKLDNIAKAYIDEEKDIHCENLIGATTLPLGVAGPLNNYYIPLATTEGALVASVNRGCKAIESSGGAVINVESVGTTRGPVYETSGIKASLKFKKWLDDNFASLKKVAESTSSYLKLKKIETRMTGCYVYVRFYYDTTDAMGMNMATIATDSLNQLIESKTGIECLAVSGNFCIDKKPSWLNFVSGRGKRIWAEVTIKNPILKSILNTTSQKIYDVWLAKCMIGSAMSGSMGFNAHYANIVAAFFAATGQDLAHVVEGSMGITTAKVLENKDLYFSVYLPALMLGTVGGGTRLKTKKEAIAITGAKNITELVEVLAGAVLAGELSLLASLSEGSLAEAHQKLGR